MREDSSFREESMNESMLIHGQSMKWDWMELGREVMPKLEGYSIVVILETMRRWGM